jgi:hypothetical protein
MKEFGMDGVQIQSEMAGTTILARLVNLGNYFGTQFKH